MVFKKANMKPDEFESLNNPLLKHLKPSKNDENECHMHVFSKIMVLFSMDVFVVDSPLNATEYKKKKKIRSSEEKK